MWLSFSILRLRWQIDLILLDSLVNSTCKDLLVNGLHISDFLTEILELWVSLPQETSLQFESMDFLVLLSWGRKSLSSKVVIHNDNSLWKRRTSLGERWAGGRGITEGKFLLKTPISVSPFLVFVNVWNCQPSSECSCLGQQDHQG